mgnify:CR=1 FL=1
MMLLVCAACAVCLERMLLRLIARCMRSSSFINLCADWLTAFVYLVASSLFHIYTHLSVLRFAQEVVTEELR